MILSVKVIAVTSSIEMHQLEADTTQGAADFESQIDRIFEAATSRLVAKIDEWKNDIIRWMFIFWVLNIVTMFIFFKLMK